METIRDLHACCRRISSDTLSVTVGVDRIFESVCLFVCLFDRSITQKRMTPKCYLTFEYPRSDGQGHRINKCIFHTNSWSIYLKNKWPKVFQTWYREWLWDILELYDMVLGLKGQMSRLGLWLGLAYSNTAWVRTPWVPSSCILSINVNLL